MITKEKITTRKIKVAVIGLGYVGLPLAVEFARNGFDVIGIDPVKEKILKLNKGENYIKDVEDYVLSEVVKNKKLIATQNFKEIKNVNVCIICVPTPLNKTWEPDMSYMINAAENVAKNLNKGTLIVLESTTYPGTTDELILPILEKENKKLSDDFFLAFSPERVDPGNVKFNTRTIPKIVGGINEESTNLACTLYSQVVVTVVPVSSAKVAETAKLLENTFRTVNIALINEIALMCNQMNIDVWEVIDAAATKPFGFMPFYPGPGLGGHCLPIDPLYLAWKAKSHNFDIRFINLAAEINKSMPGFVVKRISDALNINKKAVNGSNILVFGVAYKNDIDDMRESPALTIIESLQQKGANVSYTDPYISELKWHDINLSTVDISYDIIKGFDCAVILTNHSNFDYELIVNASDIIVDTRNATKDINFGREKIIKL